MPRHRKPRRRTGGTQSGLAPAGRITEQYAPPSPRQLPELRGQLATWLMTEGERFYLVMAMAGRQWLPPGQPRAAGAAQIALQEHGRVTGGELYWVSGPMTELARHAAASLPTRELYAHDLPSRSGLMLFEAPLASYVNDGGRDVQIVAVSWGPWDGPGQAWQQGGIWLTFYSHPAPVLPPQFFTNGVADLAALGPLIIPLPGQAGDTVLGPAAATLPPILPDNEAGWPFGELDDEIPGQGTTASWALVIRAAWRLMQQPLADQTAEQPIRAARHRLARAGLPDASVRIVRIRRRERPAVRREPGGSRDYHVQWWVTGHWRRYWCGPGRTRPEDRWIAPHLAGPDDKPVRGVQRVRVWDR
jgi:hypothetical protein